ncbi:MAG TPA: HAMP domain-containing sensor histidine kinase [Geodermatophilus sp.]|nr:HAMP domain-containing sensor histidine kinase [Geodermatophilus sp.]
MGEKRNGIGAAVGLRMRWLASVGCGVTLLALAGYEARHVVLVVVSALGLFAAGTGFLLRWRVTGTRATWQIGVGLVLLGLHHPVTITVGAFLDHREPGVATASGLLTVLTAATAGLRAYRGPGGPPRRRATAVTGLPGLALAAVLLMAGTALTSPRPVTAAAEAGAYLLTGALWTAVAVAAWRSDPLGTGARSSTRALAGIALAVGLLVALHGVPALFPEALAAVHALDDVGMAAVALAAGALALRQLTDALAGQERYVAGLLEQLAAHERQLQQARTCLHDGRAAVAGIRAVSSAVQHLSDASEPAARTELLDSVGAELRRLERMLRLPERSPVVSAVDVDQLVRTLVVSHRERGLRIQWEPSGRAPVGVDGDALAVIISNLLGNALAHAPEALCAVTVEFAERLTVTVADDGPGIPAARRATVFEAGARRPDSPGEGLGLAISRDLARRHGGDLEATDAAAGSRFVLTLPVRPLPAPSVMARIPVPRSERVPGPAASSAGSLR